MNAISNVGNVREIQAIDGAGTEVAITCENETTSNKGKTENKIQNNEMKSVNNANLEDEVIPDTIEAPFSKKESEEKGQVGNQTEDEKKEIPVPPGDALPLPVRAPGQQPEKPPAYM